MRAHIQRKLIATLIAGLCLPLSAYAGEAELMKQIEALTRNMDQMAKELASLKSQVGKVSAAAEEARDQVKKVEDKSSARWLQVGGDYQFRIDSLKGETQPFTDVAATFANAQNAMQAAFFANPSLQTGGAVTAMMGFQQQMNGIQTYEQAGAFLMANQQLLGGIMTPQLAAYVPAYKPKNDLMYSHRFGLDLTARATSDVSVNVRFAMNKVFGEQSENALTNGLSAPFFADRVGVFDGTLGHVPSSSAVQVDRAYVTWSNIADQDMWFSVGRRPSTHGTPSHLRTNAQRPGLGGIPALLVDYAFDGMTLGYAPDIDALPGAHAKICYGRGFESGYRDTPTNSLKDTDMLGLAVVPYDTDPLRVWVQWNRGMNIFDAPTMSGTYFGDTAARINLGDIDWFGIGAMGMVKNVGPGTLNYFADFGYSKTKPNHNVSAQFGFQGLLTGSFFMPEAPVGKSGNAIYVGGRYDLPSGTKLGLEYNRGSKNWITFAPAAYDMWTSKLGTRGDVVEAYLIQEVDAKPLSSMLAKSFFRFGVQWYDFKYTGSNNWVGAPLAIDSVNGQFMTTTPLSSAVNAYATAEVKF